MHFPEHLMMRVNSFAYLSICSTVMCRCLQLAWRIPWTEEPGRRPSMELKKLDMTWQLNHQHHRYRQALGWEDINHCNEIPTITELTPW